MPEPAVSSSPPSAAEGEVQEEEEERVKEDEISYFEFRPYRELPPSHNAQTLGKAHRTQVAESSRQGPETRPAGSTSKQTGQPPTATRNQRAVDSGKAPATRPPSGVQPRRPSGAGGGQQRGKTGSAPLPPPQLQQRPTPVSGLTSSHSPVSPVLGEGSAAGQQPVTARVMLEKQIGKITLSSELEEHWMPDKMCHECSECGVRFGIFVRKHHCRICGRIFCNNCSSQSIPAYRLYSSLNGTLRVCHDCFKIYQESQKWGPEQGGQGVVPSHLHHPPLQSPAVPFVDSRRVCPEPEGALTTASSSSSSSSLVPSRLSWDERSLVSATDVLNSPSRTSTIEFDNPVFFRRSYIKPGSLPGEQEELILALREDEVEICLEEIWKKMDDPVRGIIPQTHRYRWHTFPQSFAAREIVEWLLRQGHAYSREMAVRIGQALVHTKFLNIVSSADQQFRDVDGIFLEVGEAGKTPTQPTLPTVADAPNWFLSDDGEEVPAIRPVVSAAFVQGKEVRQSMNEAKLNVEEGSATFRKIRRTFGGNRKVKKKLPSKQEFTSSLPALVEPQLAAPAPQDETKKSGQEESQDKDGKMGQQKAVKEEERGEKLNVASPVTTTVNTPQKEVVPPKHLLLSPALPSPEAAISPNMSYSFIDQQAVISAFSLFGLSKATEAARRGGKREELMERLLSDHKKHLDSMLVQLIQTSGLSLSWLKILQDLIMEACQKVHMDVYKDDFMDVRHYVKVKKIPGGQKSACSFVSGVVFSKHVTHKKMLLSLRNPRILLLKCALEFQRRDDQLASFDTLLNQEQQYLKNLVERIKKSRPHIILVQKSVSRFALEMLHHHGIVVVLNVKPAVMARVSRGTKGQLLHSLDQLSFGFQLGSCGHFYVKTFTLPDGTHKTLMYFDECDPNLGGVITLQGGSNQELKRVKQVALFGLHIAQNMAVESSFLADEFAVPSGPLCDHPARKEDYCTPPTTPDLTLFPFSPLSEYQGSPTASVEVKEEEKVEEEKKEVEESEKGGQADVEEEEGGRRAKESSQPVPIEEAGVLTQTNEGASPSLIEQGEGEGSPQQEEKEKEVVPKPPPPPPSAEQVFQEVLETRLISSSPHISFAVPYLETVRGGNASTRRYLPQSLYWSHIFAPKSFLPKSPASTCSKAHSHSTLQWSQSSTSLGTHSFGQYGSEPASRHSYNSVSNHPLTSSIFLLSASSPEVKAIMADFRARASLPDEPRCFFFPAARKGADIYSQMREIFSKSREFEQRAKRGAGEGSKGEGGGEKGGGRHCIPGSLKSSTDTRKVVQRRAKRWNIPEKSSYSSSSSSTSSAIAARSHVSKGAHPHVSKGAHPHSSKPAHSHVSKGAHSRSSKGDLLDYVMETTHLLEPSSETIVELDVPQGIGSVLEQSRASPEPESNMSATREEEMVSPSGEWSILMEEQLLPDTAECDCLDPFNHQFIALQFSSTCHDGQKRLYPCVLPCMIPMNYYGKNDIPLGQFLHRYCFRDVYNCQACEVDMSHHQRHFVHGNMELRITVQQMAAPIPGCEAGVFTWLTCNKCFESTPLVPMMEESLCLSFAKFLELKFYSSTYIVYHHGNGEGTCTHPLHSNYTQYFCYENKLAAFEPHVIKVLEVGIPPQKITMTPSTDHVQFHHDYPHEITHLGKLIEGVFYRIIQYLQLYGAVEGMAASVQDCMERAKAMRASLRHKVKKMKELSIASGLFQPTWVLGVEGEEVESFFSLQDSTAELKKCIAEVVMCWNIDLEKLDTKVRETRETASKKESPRESTVALPVTSLDDHSSTLTVSTSSPFSSPKLKRRTTVNENQLTATQSRDLSPLRGKKEEEKKGRSGSDNLSDCTTYLQVEGMDSKQLHHRRNLSDSVTLSRSGVTDQDSSEGGRGREDLIDSGGSSKTLSSRSWHVRHHSLTDTVTSSKQCESEEEELLRTVREGEVGSGNWHQQRAFVEEMADFVNKLRGKEIEDPTKFYSVRSSTQMSQDQWGSEDQPKPAPRSSPITVDESDGSATRKTGLTGSSRKVLMDKFSVLLSKPFQKLPSPFEPSEHHVLRANSRFMVGVYENEPTSIIAFALCSREYSHELSLLQQEERRRSEGTDSTFSGVQPSMSADLDHAPSAPTAASKASSFVKNILWRKSQAALLPPDTALAPDAAADAFWGEFGEGSAPVMNAKINSTDSSSRFSCSHENGHISMEFADETTKFFCKIYYAEEFRNMRELIFPCGEDRFVRSLARCVKFEAKGGKSRAMFLKTYEDRLIMKQVQMVEITSFVEIAPKYFQHVTDAIRNQRPLVLAKILGAYSIGFRNSKTGRSKRHHVIIMENLLYGHHCSKVFDLKGSMRGRYVTRDPKKDSKGDVLMDENFLEFIYSHPVYVWPHSKAVLIRAISADTQFLADNHIMDYSLLTAIDEETGEVVVGVIDFVRPFTFDKKVEMYIKKAGRSILPTVVYPSLYRRRFIEAMERYFTPVPDKWTGLGADIRI